VRALLLAALVALLPIASAAAAGCNRFEWIKLAAEPISVEGGDVDLDVDPNAGGFYAVMFEVRDSNVAINNVRIVFKGGRVQSPKKEFVLGPSKSRAYVDFSQNLKEVERVEFTYRILRGTAIGEISFWGKQVIALTVC